MLVQAPEGTSLEGEQQIAIKAEKIIRAQPEVLHVFDVGGFSFTGLGAQPRHHVRAAQALERAQRRRRQSIDARDSARSTAAFYMTDPAKRRSSRSIRPRSTASAVSADFSSSSKTAATSGLPALMRMRPTGSWARRRRIRASATSSRSSASTRRNSKSNIDRNKAKRSASHLNDVFNTMEVDLGSLYVNNFTYLNRSWQVDVQADAPYRNSVSSLQSLYVSSSAADSSANDPAAPHPEPDVEHQRHRTGMTPLSAMVSEKHEADRADHHALQPVPQHRDQRQRGARPRLGRSDRAMAADRAKVLPHGHELSSGRACSSTRSRPAAQSAFIFVLGLVFVFLVLSAQYESFDRSADRAAGRAGRVARRARVSSTSGTCRSRFSRCRTSRKTSTRRSATSC